MDYISLGKSNLLVSRTAFGTENLGKTASEEEAFSLVKKAFEAGVNFFDTSALTPESEKRLGEAIKAQKIRSDVVIATKSVAKDSSHLERDVEKSIQNLETDFIDLYQIERSKPFFDGESDSEILETLKKMKNDGIIRHFGIVTESMEVAQSTLLGWKPWETVQFPFNMLCALEVEQLVSEFARNDIGFIAMRPLCGGVVSNIPLALGYLRQFENVVPVWGAMNDEELSQILYFTENPPLVDEKFLEEVSVQRAFFN